MSADNWTHCPRCTARMEKTLRQRETAIEKSYGQVPIDQFDSDRERLRVDKGRFERREPTFREDYEITGADTGVVSIDYSGCCTECGLSLTFTETRPIPGVKLAETAS